MRHDAEMLAARAKRPSSEMSEAQQTNGVPETKVAKIDEPKETPEIEDEKKTDENESTEE